MFLLASVVTLTLALQHPIELCSKIVNSPHVTYLTNFTLKKYVCIILTMNKLSFIQGQTLPSYRLITLIAKTIHVTEITMILTFSSS